MIFLFAPSKTFRETENITELTLRFPKATKHILGELKKLSKLEIMEKFKVSETISNEVFYYYKQFKSGASYRAIDLFHGETYKGLEPSSLTEEALQLLHEKTFILDAFYGIIKPLDGIKPYRLDFMNGFNVKSIWTPILNQFFQGIDEPILSLSSLEFSQLIKHHPYLYEVTFIDCKNGTCKAISVLNKQNRGKLLRYLIENKIDRIEDLPKNFLGYELTLKDHVFEYVLIH